MSASCGGRILPVSLWDLSVIHRITSDRAGHAVAAPSTASQLGGLDFDNLHPGLREQSIGRGVAVVSNDDTGLKSYHIIAVIPLLALGFPAVATRLDGTQTIQSQGAGDDIGEMTVVDAHREARRLAAGLEH